MKRALLIAALLLVSTGVSADGLKSLTSAGSGGGHTPPAPPSGCSTALKFNEACDSQYLGVIL